MKLDCLDLARQMLALDSPTASITVIYQEGSKDGDGQGWRVDWKIKHGPYAKVTGNVLFSADELKSAFGLDGGDSAVSGKYIKSGNHLSIPSKGDGGDGNPNAAVLVTQEIAQAMVCLVDCVVLAE